MLFSVPRCARLYNFGLSFGVFPPIVRMRRTPNGTSSDFCRAMLGVMPSAVLALFLF
jgi:hypothetical protein